MGGELLWIHRYALVPARQTCRHCFALFKSIDRPYSISSLSSFKAGPTVSRPASSGRARDG